MRVSEACVAYRSLQLVEGSINLMLNRCAGLHAIVGVLQPDCVGAAAGNAVEQHCGQSGLASMFVCKDDATCMFMCSQLQQDVADVTFSHTCIQCLRWACVHIEACPSSCHI